jgi:hypothetical protein
LRLRVRVVAVRQRRGVGARMTHLSVASPLDANKGNIAASAAISISLGQGHCRFVPIDNPLTVRYTATNPSLGMA